MNALDDLRATAPADLPAEAQRLRDAGWRLVTATTVRRESGWTVLYHFERQERLRHLRVEIGTGEQVPAIDEAYPAAFLVENEMRELQALPVAGISIDYGGRLYRDLDGPEGWVHVHAAGRGEAVPSASRSKGRAR